METTQPSPTHYSRVSITLHWLMALLLVAVAACMELRGFAPKGSDLREGLKTWHYMLGLSVLALVALRLVLRLCSRTPPIVPTMPVWQERLSQLTHVALYGLMFGLPLMGWLLLSAKGTPIPFFGLQLPALITQNKDAARWIKEMHETGATMGYVLVAVHAAAGLFHHYVQRDNTLLRMLLHRD